MKSFEIVLKNEKLRSYSRVAVLILFLHLFYFSYYLLKTASPFINGAVLIGIAGTMLALLLQWLAYRQNKRYLVQVPLIFLFLALVWFNLDNYLLVAVLVVLAILHFIAVRKTTITITTQQILINAVPKRTVNWDELNNAILKDRILTLDFKSDRLIQAEIAPESHGINEQAFNEFCREQLAASPQSPVTSHQ